MASSFLKFLNMTIKEKVQDKEKAVKALLDGLRTHLNSKRIEFDKAPNSWEYISTLGIAETKLKELLDYLKEAV